MDEAPEAKNGNSLITYCDRCGARIDNASKSEEIGVAVCEDCRAGRNIPKQRAADSTQIPYVQVPTDADILRDVRQNVRSPG